jgi:hypothetical protein
LNRIDFLRREITLEEKEQPSEEKEKKLKSLREKLNKEFKQIGPDLNILAYAFNFFDDEGNINTNLKTMNAFNKAIYEELRPQFHKPASQLNLIVSHTSLDSNKYGPEMVESFLDRLKIEKPNESYSVTTLRSVMMNPWITETETGSFVETIIKELTKTVKFVLKKKKLKEKKKISNL